jgi:phycobilisome rod-core linker protein
MVEKQVDEEFIARHFQAKLATDESKPRPQFQQEAGDVADEGVFNLPLVGIVGKAEEIAWSAVIMTRGIQGAVDDILNSQEYLDNFGYDTVPYHRNRVVGSRDLGETPFNITTPRYEAYHRGVLGFPQIIYTGTARSLPERARQRRGGYPEDYLPWVRTLPATRTRGSSGGSANIDYLAKVPYRSVGR